jgi:hypothetical protein
MAAEMAAAVSTAVLNGPVALVEVMMAKVLGDAVAPGGDGIGRNSGGDGALGTHE